MSATLYDKDNHVFGQYCATSRWANRRASPPPDGKRFTAEYLEVALPVEMELQAASARSTSAAISGLLYGQFLLFAAIVGLILLVTTIVTLGGVAAAAQADR